MTGGAYVLIFELPGPRRVVVGRLGTFDFEAGQYAYVGSAMNGLEGRIRRHLRPEKRRRWHIDYLLEVAVVTMVLAVPGGRDLECELSRRLSRHTDSLQPVPKFGSSGCRCRSHLHYWPLPIDSGRVAEIALRQCGSAPLAGRGGLGTGRRLEDEAEPFGRVHRIDGRPVERLG